MKSSTVVALLAMASSTFAGTVRSVAEQVRCIYLFQNGIAYPNLVFEFVQKWISVESGITKRQLILSICN